MGHHESFMNRCLFLAEKGKGLVAPNPMVGAVVVHKGRIIGEGYHHQYGGAHAEVNAIAAVENKDLLKESTIYVSLEPCSHHGKTPPCADLIISHQIPRVVLAMRDPNPLVAGRGIARLKEHGVEVIEGVCEEKAIDLNRRFITFHREKRPYIILKWAESANGFMDIDRNEGQKGVFWITAPETKVLVHKWRSEEAGILVGANTVEIDNPSLTAREYHGKNPVRMVIAPNGISAEAAVLNGDAQTVVFHQREDLKGKASHFYSEGDLIEAALNWAFENGIQSILVEGGPTTLDTFIKAGYWDEIKRLMGNTQITSGKPAPDIRHLAPMGVVDFGPDRIYTYRKEKP